MSRGDIAIIALLLFKILIDFVRWDEWKTKQEKRRKQPKKISWYDEDGI